MGRKEEKRREERNLKTREGEARKRDHERRLLCIRKHAVPDTGYSCSLLLPRVSRSASPAAAGKGTEVHKSGKEASKCQRLASSVQCRLEAGDRLRRRDSSRRRRGGTGVAGMTACKATIEDSDCNANSAVESAKRRLVNRLWEQAVVVVRVESSARPVLSCRVQQELGIRFPAPSCYSSHAFPHEPASHQQEISSLLTRS